MTSTSSLHRSDSLQSNSLQSSSLHSSASSFTSSEISASEISSAGQGQQRPIGSPSQYDLLKPVRNWLDQLQVHDSKTAHRIAKLIPAQCPFERDVKLLGRTVAHIPPLCKLNPLYDQFVGLRFRALCYLVDECGEDIQSYC